MKFHFTDVCLKSKVRLSFHFNEKCLANFLFQGKKKRKIYYISFHVPYFLDVMTYSIVWGYIMSPFSFRLVLKKILCDLCYCKVSILMSKTSNSFTLNFMSLIVLFVFKFIFVKEYHCFHLTCFTNPVNVTI